MEYLLFFLVILAANIIQGITGFAGTILAMPPSLMLVGYDVAKPVLNVLGLFSGIYVFAEQHKKVNWQEVKRIVLVMAVGILGGILMKSLFDGQEDILYQLLGIFVILLALSGLYQMAGKKEKKEKLPKPAGTYAMLVSAGIVHGMFVSGGPLLIGYLTRKIKDKVSFRATISTVWIILNTMILIDDIRNGLWNMSLVKTQLISVPFLLAGMFIGSKLYTRMSQKLFMIITYILLFISGISLLVK